MPPKGYQERGELLYRLAARDARIVAYRERQWLSYREIAVRVHLSPTRVREIYLATPECLRITRCQRRFRRRMRTPGRKV
jgi:hypothetical protein